jgi:hypothetical protein
LKARPSADAVEILIIENTANAPENLVGGAATCARPRAHRIRAK